MPATRREKPKQKKIPRDAPDIDDVFQLSQSSDDVSNSFMAEIVQQYQTTLNKKKKEKEPKFLRALQKELDNALTARSEEYGVILEELNLLYDQFVVDYAAAEDQIRHIHEELEQEYLRLLTFMDQKLKATLECDKQREKGHIKALAGTRKACEDFRHLIESFAGIEVT